LHQLGQSDPAVAEALYNHASSEGAATEIQDHPIYEAKSLSLRRVECELNSSRILGDRNNVAAASFTD
jgi:hypothetical protein